MSERVLLHVGTPKTGTSYLQDVLFRNRVKLAAARHHLPGRAVRRALPRGPRPDEDAVGRAAGRGDRRLGRPRRGGPQGAGHGDRQPRDPGHRLALAGQAGAGVDRLRRRHRGPRDPVGARPGPADPRRVAGERQAPRAAVSYGDFLDADPGPRAGQPDRHRGSGASRRSRTSSTAGATTCRPSTCTSSPSRRRAVRPSCSGSGSARRSASTASTSTSRPSGSTRRSGVPEIALIRRINRRANEELHPPDYRPLVRELLAHQTLSQRTPSPRLALPPDVHPWVQELSQSWVEEIRRRGYDVVGELSDLIGAPPVTDYADPDRPAERQVADAAVDAIKALLLDNARLRHEEERLHGELARGAPGARAGLPAADVPAAPREGRPRLENSLPARGC